MSINSSQSALSPCFLFCLVRARAWAFAFFALAFCAATLARLWLPLRNSSSFNCNRLRAILRFWGKDRVSWHSTLNCVGLCKSITLLFVLLIFCPPGLCSINNFQLECKTAHEGLSTSRVDLPTATNKGFFYVVLVDFGQLLRSTSTTRRVTTHGHCNFR
jgi:hypothetical protein